MTRVREGVSEEQRELYSRAIAKTVSLENHLPEALVTSNDRCNMSA
jgi:hypothetical protein